jgi:hypothetical protein
LKKAADFVGDEENPLQERAANETNKGGMEKLNVDDLQVRCQLGPWQVTTPTETSLRTLSTARVRAPPY